MFHFSVDNVLRCTSGSVAVSTAIIAPILILMLCGVVDIGRATYDATSLASAVRAGAQHALRAPNDMEGIKAAVSAASTLNGEEIIQSDAEQYCQCADEEHKQCTVVCAPKTFRMFVKITATHKFSKIMPSSIVIPEDLSAQVIVRVQ
jgi:Flp pilus assembly protein TadG